MKYRTTQSFLAFGKACEPGDIVELTEDQARTLRDLDAVTDYETRVAPLPDNKAAKKKPSASSRVAPAARKKTRKKSKKPATKR